ncbi:hypothetical protein GN956_G19057 [Arapaima gigas]
MEVEIIILGKAPVNNPRTNLMYQSSLKASAAYLKRGPALKTGVLGKKDQRVALSSCGGTDIDTQSIKKARGGAQEES